MYEAVVIGVSAGGLQAMKTILPTLSAFFPLPIAIVQHIAPHSDSFMATYLDDLCALHVKEAEPGEMVLPGTVYLAPPGYHLLVEAERSFSLSMDGRINFSCPSIDVLFESAADVYRDRLIGIVLTGANSDGSQGLKTIKAHGGLAIVQNPESAEAPFMPQSAIEAVKPDYVLDLEGIASLLMKITNLGVHYGTGTY